MRKGHVRKRRWTPGCPYNRALHRHGAQTMDADALLALHRAAAAKIDANPRLLRTVREHLARRRREERGELPRGFEYWEHMLELLSWNEIRPMLTEDSDEHRRLRVSSPFLELLTEKEKAETLETHAAP